MNPKYPPMSKKLGKKGKVVLKALVDDSGNAKIVEIKQSSGYQRLDGIALEAFRT